MSEDLLITFGRRNRAARLECYVDACASNSKSTVEHRRSVVAGRSETVQSFFRSHIDSAFRECGSRVGAFAEIIHRQYVPIAAGLQNGNFPSSLTRKTLPSAATGDAEYPPKAPLTRPAFNT